MSGMWIEDGYTVEDTLPAFGGLWPETPYRYRPALFGQRAKWQGATTPAGSQKVAAEIVAEHLVEFPGLPSARKSWAAKLETIHPNALNYLLNAVLGYTAPQPAGTEAEADAKN